MVIKVKNEKIDVYKTLHKKVWPEVLKMIRQCNISNYSIYLKDDYLFSYFEYKGQDFKADMDLMAADPATQDWWALCKPCMEPVSTCEEGEWWSHMEEVFHLE
jgi:L-rhamnose mutarotase